MYGEYVPVAERRALANAEIATLRSQGMEIEPVELEPRKAIARSFWGKGWCEHLESFSDYSNRLPRGRTYARNGSICHLAIKPGLIEALVSGSELYKISITVKPLKADSWTTIKDKCVGGIGSMIELLQGRLSDQVMSIVSDREHGLFPKPDEIALDCSCPDWAVMCKHVAAALYGVGARLDQHPELLFILRDVDAEELISADIALPEAQDGDSLDADALSGIFGIDLDTDEPAAPIPRAKSKASKKTKKTKRQSSKSAKKKRRPSKTTAARSTPRTPTKTKEPADKGRAASQPKTASAKSKARAAKTSPAAPTPHTGKSVARLRKSLRLSVAEMSERLGVTAPTLRRWESIPGRLRLQTRTQQALDRLKRQHDAKDARA